jgi:sRNA-binding carbon storage regulator CsrA
MASGLVISRKLGEAVRIGPVLIVIHGWGYKPGTHEVGQVKLRIEAPPEMHIERDDCKTRTAKVHARAVDAGTNVSALSDGEPDID